MNSKKILLICLSLAIAILITCALPLSPLEEAPTGLTYTPSEFVTYQDRSITAVTPTFNGYADSFSCSPRLPDSLSMDTRRGIISGKIKSAQIRTAYTITAFNKYTGAQTTSNIGISSYAYPKIRVQPGDQVISFGGSAEFSIIMEGGASPFTYQWYKGINVIPNGTSATYSISAATSADTGSYYCVATDALSTPLTSVKAHCTIGAAAAPVISTHPQSQSPTIGAKVNLSVVASGTDLKYVWLRNGQPISNAVSSTYQIDSATPQLAGAYRVVVWNSLGTDSSDTAWLTVAENSYNITVTITGTGSATCNLAAVTSGMPIAIPYNGTGIVSFTVPTGSSISQVLVDGQDNQSARLSKGVTFSPMQSNHTVAVTFTVNRYRVVVSSNDTAFCTILKIPANLDMVSHHDSITLIAVKKSGYYFAGWSGNVPAALQMKDTLGLRVDSALTIVGQFAEVGKFALVTTALPQATYGSIVKNPEFSQYTKGTSVTVTARASEGYQFVRWQSASTATDTQITVIMDTTKNLAAQFQKITNILTSGIVPLGAGAVSLTKDTTLGYFDTLSVSATPAASIGYSFKAWRKTGGSGTVAFKDSTQSTTTLSIRNGSVTIAAVFIRLDQFTLSVNKQPLNGGAVNLVPAKQRYAYGDTVTLSAQQNLGYVFTGWSGDTTLAASVNPLKIIMTKSFSVTAGFGPGVKTDSLQAIAGQSLNGYIRQATDSPGAGVLIVPQAGKYSDNIDVFGTVTLPIQRR